MPSASPGKNPRFIEIPKQRVTRNNLVWIILCAVIGCMVFNDLQRFSTSVIFNEQVGADGVNLRSERSIFMATGFHSYPQHRPDCESSRRQENPSRSRRLSQREQFVLWGRSRSWYPYRGYGRKIARKTFLPILLDIPSESFSLWRLLIPGLIFLLIPILLFPLYPEIGRRLYLGFPFLAKALRPPTPTLFFREMYLLIISGVSIVIIQTIFALLFLRKKRTSGRFIRVPWGEASIVGWLLSLGVFGVLRGFQAFPSDNLFFPAQVLGAAIFCWLLISGIILFPSLTRK